MTETHSITLRQVENFQFSHDYGGSKPTLISDEPPPLGAAAGPSPVQLLLSAVGSCMSSSFNFAMKKFREAPGAINTTATATVGRDEANHLRVQQLEIAIHFAAEAASVSHLARVLEQFESFCTVGAAVARGIPTRVTVTDGTGTMVKG
ncbi:hypothetical protein GCM10010909_14300 [Acidocella aquatica]|uniref:OsmC family protein n=1 Tax=Acidocella aquatica TaxID=1922313 RepID=A0ABQ6A608_9PROT|nr:OsmC family protein [Acidocella aquatica]GLR66750.1 hypothetical protein GCM10010909_14300 [Acidocella aquatica]